MNFAYANTLDNLFAGLFGVIVIAAIFGTSILRDFQRDTYQIPVIIDLQAPPTSPPGLLPSSAPDSSCSGMICHTLLGTFVFRADHTRIVPNHLWAYLQPFFSILVVQIFFIGSAFFAVSALTRKIFVVYLQGVALFMVYVIYLTVFCNPLPERFWSGIFDPIGFILFRPTSPRYWTVIEEEHTASSLGRLLWPLMSFLCCTVFCGLALVLYR